MTGSKSPSPHPLTNKVFTSTQSQQTLGPNKTNTMKIKLLKAAAACGTLLLALSAAHADQLSVEKFSGYVGSSTNSSLTASTQPTVAGYTGNWSYDGSSYNLNPVNLISNSLSYTNSLYTIGASVASAGYVPGATINGRAFRLLDSTLISTTNSTNTLFMSFLMNTAGSPATQSVFSTISLYNGAAGVNNDSNRVADFGIDSAAGGNNYVLGASTNTGTGSGPREQFTNTGVASTTNTTLLVAAFNFNANPLLDTITMWVNPTLGGGTNSAGTSFTLNAPNLAFDRITISGYSGSQKASEFANIVWANNNDGNGFNEVTAVPEPATYALMGLGALVLVLAYRRRVA
jgi:hypothetical protein